MCSQSFEQAPTSQCTVSLTPNKKRMSFVAQRARTRVETSKLEVAPMEWSRYWLAVYRTWPLELAPLCKPPSPAGYLFQLLPQSRLGLGTEKSLQSQYCPPSSSGTQAPSGLSSLKYKTVEGPPTMILKGKPLRIVVPLAPSGDSAAQRTKN
eukprot:CAMPEP_0115492758 /NCGR_PEP_ID=MMETSP0271-20121206/63809_1 /TAXON_ID=71861 /ORGANISM="Scrippsiella trochoidea, Strain CCMP3099" /LENGTH=151 /DNA_ID=CAMNT_0002921195 /DNA_START=1028 /DNA_END=1483 /DNA_ORIENTATION=+